MCAGHNCNKIYLSSFYCTPTKYFNNMLSTATPFYLLRLHSHCYKGVHEARGILYQPTKGGEKIIL